MATSSCSLLFSPSTSSAPSDSDASSSGSQDANTGGIPAVFTPQIFPDVAESMGLGSAYLFEGEGFRYDESMRYNADGNIALTAAGIHEPVPLVVTGLVPTDTVTLQLPSGFNEKWILCGQEVSGNVAVSEILNSASPAIGCTRSGATLGLAVVVPVDAGYQMGTTESLRILVVRSDSETFTLKVKVAGLDEVGGDSLPTDGGLYSKIVADWALTGSSTTFPAGTTGFRLRSMTDIIIAAGIDVSGQNGLPPTINTCSGSTCKGGAPGIGGAAGGDSNCASPPCHGKGPGGGNGDVLCPLDSAVAQDAAGGGGGGHRSSGSSGVNGARCASLSPPATSGPVGGAAYGQALLPLALADGISGGSGGGAGANIQYSSNHNLFGGGGGGGGGSVDIQAMGQVVFLTASGLINASGGDGAGRFASGASDTLSRSGQGGGGSGGSVQIRAGSISIGSENGVSPISVAGGLSGSSMTKGHGALGRIRLDGRSRPLTGTHFRGPNSDTLPPVASIIEWKVRGHKFIGSNGDVRWAYRLAGSSDYTLKNGTTSTKSQTLTLGGSDSGVKNGLYEVCMLAHTTGAQSSETKVSAIAPASKHCAWAALVAGI